MNDERAPIYWARPMNGEMWKFYTDGIAVRRRTSGVIEIKTETHDAWVEVK